MKNVSDVEKKYFLELKKSGIKDIHFFTQQSSPLINDLENINYEPNDTLPNARFYYHKISLEPDEEIIYYVAIQFLGHAKRLPVILYSESAYFMHIATVNIFSGLFYGMLVIFMFVTLTILLSCIKTRAMIMIYFNHLMTILFLLNIDGYGYTVNITNTMWLTNNVSTILLYLIFISYTQFSSLTFKETCRTTKRSCASLTVLSLTGIFLLVIQLVFNIRYDISRTISGIYAIIILLHLFIVFRRSRFTDKVLHGFYYASLISISLLIVLYVIYFSIDTLNVNVHEFLFKLVTIGLFTYILAAIVRQISVEFRDSKKTAIENLESLNFFKEKVNIKLEETVRERTNSLKEANRRLSLSLKRNNEITDELHRQRSEIDQKNSELEDTLKKLSTQNIRIQRAILTNEDQKQKLSESLETIYEKNYILELQNEEIKLQRERISVQNILLEERARNIKDSLLYAERIQSSFFSPISEVKKIFPNSFVFLKPKDILSGDIYFIDSLENEGSELKLAAAVDCTGHGIPGALMSIMANDAYHEVLHGDKLTDPGQILTSLNEKVISSLNKNSANGHIDDGMDMSLIVVNYKTRTFHYSGARNPLFFFKNNILNTQKGHIHSVGTLPIDGKQIVFPSHCYNFDEGDTIYLFSDGYADQFGGADWSKFKRVRFQNLLSDIHKMPMEKQLAKLESVFNEWKGDYEQIDDVLVIGIRL